jgi:hypothetical protein
MREIGFTEKLIDQTTFSRKKVKRFVFTDDRAYAQFQPVLIPAAKRFLLEGVSRRLIP